MLGNKWRESPKGKMVKPEPVRSSPGGFGGERVRAQKKKEIRRKRVTAGVGAG